MSYELTKEALEEALASPDHKDTLREVLRELALDPTERYLKRLYWRDSCENWALCKWIGVGAGAGAGTLCDYVNQAAAEYNGTPRNVSPFEGDYCLRVRNPINPFFYALSPTFGIFEDGLHSYELRWLMDARCKLMQLRVTVYDGTDELTAAFEYAANVHLWRYYTSGGNWVVIPSVPEHYIAHISWNYLRLVVDWKNRIYKRFETNRFNVDLSSLNLPICSTPAATPRAWFNVILMGSMDSAGDPMHFDDIRVYKGDELP